MDEVEAEYHRHRAELDAAEGSAAALDRIAELLAAMESRLQSGAELLEAIAVRSGIAELVSHDGRLYARDFNGRAYWLDRYEGRHRNDALPGQKWEPLPPLPGQGPDDDLPDYASGEEMDRLADELGQLVENRAPNLQVILLTLRKLQSHYGGRNAVLLVAELGKLLIRIGRKIEGVGSPV